MASPNDEWKRLIGQTTKRRVAKYGNVPVEVDGVRYDSKAEYAYKAHLDLRVKAGDIKGYDYHVKVPLIASSGRLVGYYEVDYLVYLADDSIEYHDVKAPGTKTDLFDWKARHVKAQYGNPVMLIDSKTFKATPCP